jgi:hemin uptake protein HemP
MSRTPFPAASAAQQPPSLSEGQAPPTTFSPGTSVCVDSAELLRGQKTVDISHNGLTYRLQATRLGKLILTK